MSTETSPATVNGGQRMLFIAYHFPPSAAIGGQRVVNFARGLRAAGWSPYILTIRDQDVEQLDRGRVDQATGLTITKARVLPTILDAALAVARLLRGRRGSRAVTLPEDAAPTVGAPAAEEGIARQFRRYALSMLALPDLQRGWILPAAFRAIQTIRRERITWIMTSCPPYSVHLIGLIVKLITGVRWVADFRDPWMTTGSKRLYPTSALSKKIEGWLERLVMERADVVTFNVDRLRRAYQGRYAHVPTEKFVFIPNGIAGSAGAITPAKKYDTFTLSYTGALYVGRSAEPIFQAIARLIENGSITAEAVRVKLVGQCREMNGVPTSTVVSRYGLDSIVDVIDPVPQKEAQQIIRQSHLALLLAPNLPYQIPAKVYDYLGAGTPILAIAEEGGTADLIRETDFGKAFPSEDVAGIAQVIYQEFTARGADSPNHASVLARFDVKRITADLLAQLDSVEADQRAQFAVTR